MTNWPFNPPTPAERLAGRAVTWIAVVVGIAYLSLILCLATLLAV